MEHHIVDHLAVGSPAVAEVDSLVGLEVDILGPEVASAKGACISQTFPHFCVHNFTNISSILRLV